MRVMANVILFPSESSTMATDVMLDLV